MQEHCIFCRIRAQALPAARVLDEPLCSVIMDAYPLTRGHVLVISNSHAERVNDLPDAERQALFEVGARVETALRGADPTVRAVNWLINDGKGAWQHVPHVHLHLIPRRRSDVLRIPLRFTARPVSMRWPPRMGPLESYAGSIRRQMSLAQC